MNKFFLFVIFTLTAGYSSSFQIDTKEKRIAKLEQMVDRLEVRIQQLEKRQVTSSTQKEDEHLAVKWKNKRNWRELRRGMSKGEVESLLGEPGKIASMSFADVYYYPDMGGSSVTFSLNGTVDGWRE